MMFEVRFNKVLLARASKYLILVVAGNEAKRTRVSEEWTSSPQFPPVTLKSLSSLEVRVCEATSTRKLKVLGSGTILQEQLRQEEPFFEGDLRIEQSVEGTAVCVGICNLTILRLAQLHQAPQQAQEEEGEEGEEEAQGPHQQEIRFEFHCGHNFYLGAGFRMEVVWGSVVFRSSTVRDRLSPVWGEQACLSGPGNRGVQIRVVDDRQSILQSVRLPLSALRLMWPYHIRLRFREQIMGALPEVLFTVLRESFPLHSITQIPVRFRLRGLAEESAPLLLAVSFRESLELPRFVLVDRGLRCSFSEVNRLLEGGQQEERVELLALPRGSTLKNFSVFKSYLSRPLFLHCFRADWTPCFGEGGPPLARLIEFRSGFEAVLRKVYYFTIKRTLEIDGDGAEDNAQGLQGAERWRALSANYLLRHRLVGHAQQRIAQLKTDIHQAGQHLVGLKKTLLQVKTVSEALAAKERLMLAGRARPASNQQGRKAKEGVEDLVRALVRGQAELERRKALNAELGLRMESLGGVEEDQGDLDQQLLSNAEALLAQQEQLSRLRLMQKELPQQRQVIARLERLFEEGEVAFKANAALRHQAEHLKAMRQQRREGLGRVYALLQQKGHQAGSLKAQVRRAEEELRNLNAHYAKLITF